MSAKVDPKRLAGEKAAETVEDGMILGLGTGSTVYWTIRKLGERVKEGLRIRAIPTSEHTSRLCAELGIPLTTLEETEFADLAIDGADEIDPRLNLIKGGGGALFREKVVALASRRFYVVAEETKLVDRLGKFLVPVEIVPFGWEATARFIRQLGGRAQRRNAGGQPFVTDNGNWILDCDFGLIEQPAELHLSLKTLTGVVETGLFPEAADQVFVGSATGVRIMGKGRA